MANPELTTGQLPRRTTAAMLVTSAVVSTGILALAQAIGFVQVTVLAVVLFLGAMYALSHAVEGPRKAIDRLARHIVTGCFLIALLPLVSVLHQTLSKGLARFDAEFFAHSMRSITSEGGGAAHAIWGTLIITGIATLLSVPVGLFTAIYLVEYGSGRRLATAVRFFVDVMTGIPSIVAGLFAYTVFSLVTGPGTRNGLAGAMALSLLMIPTVVRSAEEMLRLVPPELREASYALGVPKWRTIIKVVVPTSLAGIVTGVVLAIARVIGETAPLLVTAGITASLNTNPAEGPMGTLPVFVYYQYMTPGAPQGPYYDRAWAGALTLILIVMGLAALGRLIAWRFAPKTGR